MMEYEVKLDMSNGIYNVL